MANRSEWVKRVAAWRASGQTAAQFCAEREFKVGTLKWWSSRIRPTPRTAARPAVRMARVVRPAASAEGTATTSGGSVVVEVYGVRVTVGAGFDRGTLGSVIDVLESRRGGAR